MNTRRGEGMAKSPLWFDSAALPKDRGSKKLRKAIANPHMTPWCYIQNQPSVRHIEVNSVGDYESITASFEMRGGELLTITVAENEEGQAAIIQLLEVLVRIEKTLTGIKHEDFIS